MKRNKKAIMTTIIVLGMLLTLLPGNFASGQDIQVGGTLTTPLGADAHALNPFTWGTTYEAYVIEHIYDALAMLDVDNQPQPVMATGWSHTEDNVNWTFNIHDNIKWHDGEPFTIDDVIFTYQLLLDDPDIPRRSWMFDEVEDVIKVNDTAVKVVFGYGPKSADVLNEFALTWIVPEHIWTDVDDIYTFANDENPIGSGPFKFIEWSRGSYFRFERHADYHLAGPYVEYKIIQIIREVETGYYAVSSGDIEVYGEVPPELEQVARVDPDIQVHEYLQDYWVYLGLNQRRYPNNITEFRQAVLYGINRTEIVDLIRYGRGEVMPASCSLPYGPYYNPDAKSYEYDPDEARQLLDDLGFVDTDEDGIREDDNGDPLEFTLLVSSDAQVSVDSSLFIQGYMEDIGIDVTVQPLVWDVIWDRIGGSGKDPETYEDKYDYDWAFAGWVEFWSDFHPNWARWLFSHNGWWGSENVNIPGWNNSVSQQVTELSDDILYETDEEVIKEKLDLIQELVAEDLPYLPINVLGGISLYRTDRFEGWIVGNTTGPDNWQTWLNLYLIGADQPVPGFGYAISFLTLVVLVTYVYNRKKK